MPADGPWIERVPPDGVRLPLTSAPGGPVVGSVVEVERVGYGEEWNGGTIVICGNTYPFRSIMGVVWL